MHSHLYLFACACAKVDGKILFEKKRGGAHLSGMPPKDINHQGKHKGALGPTHLNVLSDMKYAHTVQPAYRVSTMAPYNSPMPGLAPS